MKLTLVLFYVKDINASTEFYKKAFDLQIRFLDPSGVYVDFAIGDVNFGLASYDLAANTFPAGCELPGVDGKPHANKIIFSADDVEAAYNKAINAGAHSLVPPFNAPWGQTCYVRDLDGHIIEIWKMNQPM